MKRSLLALAVLTAFTGVASAQSSVTLFGIVDVNVRNQKNGTAGSINSLSTDGLASSRFGVRGVEDLGGGMRAGFWLEAAVIPDTGTTNAQFWNRRATVSLIGPFGEVRLGRDYTPTFWNQTTFDPFGTNGVGNTQNVVSVLGSGVGTLVRANNTVGYFLPSLGGVYGQLMVAAGENASPASAAPLNTFNKYTGGRVGYGAGPVNVAASYGVTDRGAGVDFKQWNAGGSFTFGTFTLMGYYQMSELGSVDQETALIGGRVTFGPGTLRASYTKSKGSSSAFTADQIAVGYIHDLSRRTALYATFSQIDNDSAARFTTSGSGPAFTAGGQKSTGTEIGIRHSF